MASITSNVLTFISVLFLLLATVFSSSSSSLAVAAAPPLLQSFTDCFLKKTSSPQLLYTPSSPTYNSTLRSCPINLRLFAAPTTHNPAAIVAATSESHASAAVACARAHGLRLRTRSGGHDYEAASYVSGDKLPFVLVDLAALRRVDVDAHSRTAWVQPGAILGELYYNVFTKTNGTAGFPAGFCPTIGVGGHIGGGGIGTISRKFGTAADNLVDARIIGVDGKVRDRRAMGEDLFWAIRGGGAASFGIVVAYKIKLVDVPPVVTGFSVTKNLMQNATKLVARWQEVASNCDRDLYIRVQVQKTTDNGNPTIQASFSSVFLGDRNRLLSVMAKTFPELGLTPEDCTEMSWLQSALFSFGIPPTKGVEALLNRSHAPGNSFKVKSDFVTTPIAEAELDNKIWKFIMDAQDEPLLLIMEPFGGRMSEISPAATPFPHRQGMLYIIQYILPWLGTDAGEAERHLDWMRKLYKFMTPYVSKNPREAYYNFKDLDLGRNPWNDGGVDRGSYERARVWGEKYFKGNFKRLALVKGKVDCGNFFRNEQTIPPLLVA